MCFIVGVLKSVCMPMPLIPQDGATPMGPWWDTKSTHLPGIFSRSCRTLHEKTYIKTTQLYWDFSDFWCRITPEPLNGKTSFQSHIVEQHKSYRMVVESWESVQANLNVPLFVQGTFCDHLTTKLFTTELMNLYRLWDLNESVLYLFGLCSPRMT